MWCAALVVMSLGVGAPAWAQTAGPSTYTGVTPPQLGSVQVGSSAVQSASSAQPAKVASSLAFTGTDATELVGIGILLIGSGALLRQLGRARRTQEG